MRRTSAGFSLIENLAALVVVSIGLLGTAALLGTALGALRASMHRQTAVMLIDDLTARLYASPRAADAATEPAALAVFAAWAGEVESRLPRGTARLTRESRDGVDIVTIDVSWDEPGSGRLAHVLDVAVRP